MYIYTIHYEINKLVGLLIAVFIYIRYTYISDETVL